MKPRRRKGGKCSTPGSVYGSAADAADTPARNAGEADPTLKLSQEMIAVIGIGVALGALILTTTSELRGEIRAVRAEGHADREAIRAEGRADREALEMRMARFEERMAKQDAKFEEQIARQDAKFEERTARQDAKFEERIARQNAKFEEQILRLTEQQGALGGLVEGLRHRQLTAAGSNDPPG